MNLSYVLNFVLLKLMYLNFIIDIIISKRSLKESKSLMYCTIKDNKLSKHWLNDSEIDFFKKHVSNNLTIYLEIVKLWENLLFDIQNLLVYLKNKSNNSLNFTFNIESILVYDIGYADLNEYIKLNIFVSYNNLKNLKGLNLYLKKNTLNILKNLNDLVLEEAKFKTALLNDYG